MIRVDGKGFWPIALGLTFISAVSVFTLLSSIWPGRVVEYLNFDVTPEIVSKSKRDAFRIMSSYRKYRDCSGIAFIIMVPQQAEAAIIVVNQALLGTRPPGEFSASRNFAIPANAPIGVVMVQEVLNYDCGSMHQTVRSPARVMTILE